MALSSAAFLKEHQNIADTMSADAVNSDAVLVIDGFENLYIKTKSFPDPILTTAAPIEVARPLGNKSKKAGQQQTTFSGSATLIETEQRDIEKVLTAIIASGGYFDAWIYHGTPDAYVNRKRIEKCFFHGEAPIQRDMESNTELLLIERDVDGNYFGEIEDGNIDTLMGMG